jgi:sugar diacid utilization regulator
MADRVIDSAAAEVAAPSPPLDEWTDITSLRSHLSSLQGLMVLAMLMNESDDEARILSLAATTVSRISRTRFQGALINGAGWQLCAGRCTNPHVQTDVEAQLAVQGVAGGSVTIAGERWATAFPLRSIEGHFGHFVVAADAEPAQSELFLLRVLAQETGVAAASARLHARDRTTAAELRTANVTLGESLAALERSTAIHERLTRVAIAGEGLEGIARAVNELTERAVIVEDQAANARAWAGCDQPDRYDADARRRRDRAVERAVRAQAPIRYEHRIYALARSRIDVLGVLVLLDPDGVAGDSDLVALEHGATVLALELARLQSIAETELRLRRDLVEELIAGTDTAGAVSRAQALGYDLERPHYVLVVEVPDRQRDETFVFHAVRRAARDTGTGTMLVTRGGVVVVLADADHVSDEFRAALLLELGDARCRVGVGSRCTEARDFPRSYKQAQLALRIESPSHTTDATVRFDDLGVYRLLAGIDDMANIDEFIRHWLGRLLDYDAGQKRSELVETVSRYLECGRNYDRTAHALNVHRSTLKYRLQRIREVSGHDLGDPDVCFNLQLATRALATLGAVGADE